MIFMSEIVNIISSQNNIFEDEFLQEYLDRGFGSLSKRDIDILVMHLLMKHSDLKGVSNFNLSMKLKLTETKIKNLKYEAKLKYSKRLDVGIKEEFLSLLSKTRLQVVGKETWISIVVEDTFLRNAIKAKVKENGSFADGAFNTEIVKISVDDFSYLMCVFSESEEQKNVEKEISNLLSVKNTLDFKDLFKMFLEEAIKGAGDEVGRQSITIGATYLSGGISVVGQIFSSLKPFIQPINKE